jgi:hypothetical protein
MLTPLQTVLGSLSIRGPLQPERLAELIPQVDPTELAVHARREGVDCLLYVHLERAGLMERIAEAERTALGGRYRETAALNMRRAADLAELAQRLEPLGGSVVVFKGLSLLEDLYKDPGLRPTGDIDLWVGTEDLTTLTETLREADFAPEPFYPDTYRRSTTTVDIHTHLLGADRVRSRELILAAGQEPMLAGLQPSGYGAAVARLGSAPEALLLGLHLLKHNADRLLWLIELNELVEMFDDEEWRRLLALADEMRQPASVHQVAFLCRLLLGDNASSRFVELDDEAELSRFHSAVLARRASKGALPLWGPLVFFSSQGGFRSRVVSVLETLFPRPEILRQIFRDAHTSIWRLYFRRFGQLVSWTFR